MTLNPQAVPVRQRGADPRRVEVGGGALELFDLIDNQSTIRQLQELLRLNAERIEPLLIELADARLILVAGYKAADRRAPAAPVTPSVPATAAELATHLQSGSLKALFDEEEDEEAAEDRIARFADFDASRTLHPLDTEEAGDRSLADLIETLPATPRRMQTQDFDDTPIDDDDLMTGQDDGDDVLDMARELSARHIPVAEHEPETQAFERDSDELDGPAESEPPSVQAASASADVPRIAAEPEGDDPFDVDFSSEIRAKAAASSPTPTATPTPTVQAPPVAPPPVPPSRSGFRRSTPIASERVGAIPKGVRAGTAPSEPPARPTAQRKERPSPRETIRTPTATPTRDEPSAEPEGSKGERYLQALDIQERTTKFNDHFKTLGIPLTADADDVRDAFHALSKRYHPDRMPREIQTPTNKLRVTVLYAAIQEAYQALLDDDARQRYVADKKRAQAPMKGPSGGGAQGKSAGIPPNLVKGDKLVKTAFEEIGLGNFKSALMNLQIAVQMHPGDPQYDELMKKVKFLEVLERGARRAEENLLSDDQMKDIVTLIHETRDLLVETPRQLTIAVSYLLEQMKDFAEVRDLIHRIPSEKLTGQHLKQLARAYIAMKQWNSAIDTLNRAATLDPSDTEIAALIASTRKQMKG